MVLAGSECRPKCQLLQTGTNNHITYIWLVLVAPIFWHYIDWWCLFMKHMWCHLVAKYKLKGICSHTWFLQVVSTEQKVSCSKQEQINTLCTFIWNWLHPSSGILILGEWCLMCQLLQTGTNYHITYICLVLVAPIFWHYIDWWCLFMKHMWCHLVAT